MAINLDGLLTDWSAADLLDLNGGESGYDLYGRYEAGNFIFALSGLVAIGPGTTFWLNTDLDQTTGFQVFGSVGAEYNINFDANGVPHLYTGSDGQTLVTSAVVDYAFNADLTAVELSISAAELGGTQALGVYVDVNNSVFIPTFYGSFTYIVAAPTPPAVVGDITLDGALTDWTAADRIDTVAPVAGYEVYGRVTGDSYVFAIKAPDGASIGPNTTIWLNTDQNVATGFNIFGGASPVGGAEYNINFDSAGVPHLYTGAAGGTLVPDSQVLFGRSSDGTIVEFAVTKAEIGNPPGIATLFDINDATFLPSSFSDPSYNVLDKSNLPVRTDFSHKVAIVYSETTAALFFGSADINVNETGYSQLFMAAQNQATMAGVPFDLLSEADLTNLANLVNYDAIIFPGFQFVNDANYTAISNNLTLLAQNYNTSLIAAGNFMTNDQTGGLETRAGDPYAMMKALFDAQPLAGGFSGSTSVTINSAGAGFDGVGGYAANEAIRTYTNSDGVGWLAFTDATPGTTPLTVIDNQTVTGAGAGTYGAVFESGLNGDRNVLFSTQALLGDNNQLWQAIDHAVNGATGPSVGLHMSRQSSVVASRSDMDTSQYIDDVRAGIYDQLLPILQQWKATYNFVGSYYINIGDNPGAGLETDWSLSLPYYQQLLAMGNEIGSHSTTHLVGLTPAENTNILTTGTGPGTFDYEFGLSRATIQAQLAAAFPGYQLTGAAVPGAPESLATAEQIIDYYDYISGGYAAVGAGYPGAFGYLTPAYEPTGKVYLAPDMKFDFTLVGFQGMTVEQATAEWQAEFAGLTTHADVPVVVWPWHDYGVTNWPDSGGTYATDMFTQLIATASNAGAEFVTLEDLADRIRSFEQMSITSSVSGDVVTATVTSGDAGKFSLDLSDLGTQVISSVAGWYAYDSDSVFMDRDGGTFSITLGASAADVTHITKLPARGELVSLSGDNTNLNFTLVGEGQLVVDLGNPAGRPFVVSGATIVSQVGDILTIDVGNIGTHVVAVTQITNFAPIITSDGGGDTGALSIAENGTVATTVTATDTDAGQSLTYSINGGADAALFSIDPATGRLAFLSAPNFEAPADNGGDNIYDVVVKVSDNGTPTASDTQALAITVANVDGIIYNGTSAADIKSGTPEDDTLNGAGGNDTLSGLGGNDTLNGGTGADTLIGGTGNDLYIVDNTGDVVLENANEGTDTVQTSVSYALSANVENLVLTGASNINGAGNALNNAITGNSGNNTLIGLGGADTIDGGAGSDTASYAGSAAGVTISLATGQVSGGDATGDILLNVENLTGSGLNDTIEGNTGNNVLAGGAGTDMVSYEHAGAAVTVSLATTTAQSTGGAGTDALSGFENLTGSAFNDVLTGSSAANTLLGLGGDDTLNGGTGADTLIGGTGNDLYIVDNTGDVVVENANEGTDTVQTSVSYALSANVENLVLTGASNINGAGNALNNAITGNSGNNTLIGLGGADTIDGGAGSDTASYAGSAAGVTISLATGQVSGGDATGDILLNVENLTGSGLNDTIEGNTGNNVLAGGAGTDMVSYEHAGAAVTVSLATTTAQSTGGAGTDALSGFENLTGSGLNDTIEGNTGNNVLAGGAGTDMVSYEHAGAAVTVSLATTTAQSTGGAGTDALSGFENLTGSAFNDVLTGSSAANTLLGLGGDDTLLGGGGADTLIGGAGNDLYVINNTGDVVTENADEGMDAIRASISYMLSANVENLILTGGANIDGAGNALDNAITGNSGNNTLIGLGGADMIDGGAGSDTASYAGSAAGVAISLATGQVGGGDATGDTLLNVENLTGSGLDDTLEGNAGNNVLAGGAGTDMVSYEHAGGAVTVSLAVTKAQNTGGAGTDTLSGFENLTGSAFNDVLTGSSAANTLLGGAGNDRLTGGGGIDMLTGGDGADTFIFTSVADIGNSTVAAGREHVTDFADFADRLDFSAIGNNQDFTLLAENAPITAAGQLRWFYDATNNDTVIEGNTNGSLAPDFRLALTGHHALAAGNFIL